MALRKVFFLGAAFACINGGFVATVLILSGVAFWLFLNSKHDVSMEYLANQTRKANDL